MLLGVKTITHANARAVAASGVTAIATGDSVIDFSGVSRCDSSAVACVLAWLRAARGAGCALRLRAVPQDLMSLARLYGVAELLPVEPGQAAAGPASAAPLQ